MFQSTVTRMIPGMKVAYIKEMKEITFEGEVQIYTLMSIMNNYTQLVITGIIHVNYKTFRTSG